MGDPYLASLAPPLSRRRAWKTGMTTKTSEDHFDVFLCYNSEERPLVRKIAQQLRERQIVPWLDEEQLQPGYPWQRVLEDQIKNIGAAAVFVGQSGLGPWQQVEQDAFLRKFVGRQCPVIPVILPNCVQTPVLPLFLEGMTWVDFRKDDPNPLSQLIWGITGSKQATANTRLGDTVLKPSVQHDKDYDRRFKLYETVKNCVNQFLINPLRFDNALEIKFLEAINEARFYFDDELHDYLETLRKHILIVRDIEKQFTSLQEQGNELASLGANYKRVQSMTFIQQFNEVGHTKFASSLPRGNLG